ncbi:hypothetical protein EYF80_021689 [Liparis tanakae]|uniref:Uncharacterized protein n=1 Tax=Liparis tanakae TaxID=230148 RepID=A0A4Z2HSR2_9TELE|nr:hypothetical protein EYF80_021689 [Liparis tanakae]
MKRDEHPREKEKNEQKRSFPRSPGEDLPGLVSVLQPGAVGDALRRRLHQQLPGEPAARRGGVALWPLLLLPVAPPLLVFHQRRQITRRALPVAGGGAVVAVRLRALPPRPSVLQIDVGLQEHGVGVLLHGGLDLRLRLVEHGGIHVKLGHAVSDEGLGGRFDLPGHDAAVVQDVFLIDGLRQLDLLLLVALGGFQFAEAAAGEPEVQHVAARLLPEEHPEQVDALLVVQEGVERLRPLHVRRRRRGAALRLVAEVQVRPPGRGHRRLAFEALALGGEARHAVLASIAAHQLTLLPRDGRSGRVLGEAASQVCGVVPCVAYAHSPGIHKARGCGARAARRSDRYSRRCRERPGKKRRNDI